MEDPQGLALAGAAELAADLAAARTTSVEIATVLLERVAALDGPSPVGLGAMLALAPDALENAATLDRERAAGHVRGPLHGVPILVKDNIETFGLPGTAGSLALAGRPVAGDAPLVARLRGAGLVVLGATNLSEWANCRSMRSTSGWSAVGGLTHNPWGHDRNAGGSSSGSGAGVTAGYAPLAIGTETDGSITCPASLNGCVGLKPTVGVLPTAGIVPVSASQDTPGPMARSVTDAALLLDALSGSQTAATCGSIGARDLRLAVAGGWRSGDGGTDAVFDDMLSTLAARGARLSEAEVVPPPDAVSDDELTVLLVEMREDLDAYLERRGGGGPRSLAEVVDFEKEHADVELVHFGHDLFEDALTRPGRDSDAYRDARARCLHWAVEESLGPALSGSDAPDALVAPAFGPAWTTDFARGDALEGGGLASPAPSIAGWPVLCLPMGFVDGLPVGVVLIGRPREEARLLAVGHAVEQILGLGVLDPFGGWARGHLDTDIRDRDNDR